jgi:Tfp pilus assembly protein FimT
MTTQMETSTRRGRSVTYIVSVLLLVVLAVIGLITFRGARQTQEAGEKADQLISEIESAGRAAPSREQIMRVLGDDGGAVCANPNEALSRATFLSQLMNGASGPGARPVIADSRVVQGQLLIIEVYCPDELAEFQQFVDSLETTDSNGG